MSDKATLKDVKHWAKDWDGIGHVAMNRNGDWVVTACGSLMTSTVIKRKPKRGVCSKCRKALESGEVGKHDRH